MQCIILSLKLHKHKKALHYSGEFLLLHVLYVQVSAYKEKPYFYILLNSYLVFRLSITKIQIVFKIFNRTVSDSFLCSVKNYFQFKLE